MTQDEIEQGKLEVERGKLKLAQETLLLEREKHEFQSGLQKRTLGVEERKSGWTAGSVLLSTVVAVLGLFVNGCWQRDIEHRTASDNFKLKAAEIVMNSNGVAATKERADALQKLFPEELTDKFSEKLQLPKQLPKPEKPEEKPDLAGDPEAKKALIKLLAEHPTEREQIIKDWLAIFDDEWPRCLQTPNHCQ